ncbi:proline utilization trans-activator [Microdochium nivale]|nr:proline utilization trans-activator [Microdochium nivale]
MAQACRRCNEKKTKCDRQWPRCSVCTKRDVECVYTSTPRRRGPGKSRQHVQRLEQRLQRMEALLEQQQPPASNPSQRLSPPHDTAGCSNPVLEPSKRINYPADVSDARSLLHSRSEDLSDRDAGQRFATSVIDPALPPAHTSSKPFLAIDKLRDRLRNSMQMPDFMAKAFARANSNNEILWFVAPLLDEINSQFPVLDSDRLLHRIGNPVSSDRQGTAWMNIIESIMARVVLARAASNGVRRCYEMAWDQMSSSLKRLPCLLLDRSVGTSADVIDALLSMALFSSSTADTKMTATLIRAGIQAHWTMASEIISGITTDERTCGWAARKIWALFTLDQELSLNHGMPSAIRHHDINTDLFPVGGQVTPNTGVSVHSQPQGLFWARVKLAIILAEISTRLYSPGTANLTADTTLAYACELHKMLHALVVDIFPTIVDSVPCATLEGAVPLFLSLDSALGSGDVSALSLHYAFSNAGSMVYDAVSRNEGVPHFTRKNARQSCLAAARSTLQAMQSSRLTSLPDLWQLLAYPVAAALTILGALLDGAPTTGAIEPAEDAELIAHLARHVHHAVFVNGYPLHRLLAGCSEMARMAQLAADGRSGGFPGIAMMTDVRDVLAKATHPMYLAQGLMGNLATRDQRLARELAGLLLGAEGAAASSSHQAPFAPDILYFDATVTLG